jgi:hypothetical protein
MNQINDLRSRSWAMIDDLWSRAGAKVAEFKTLELRSLPRELLGRLSPAQIAVATSVLLCLGLGAVVEARQGTADAASAQEILNPAESGPAASRSMDRAPATQPGAKPDDPAALPKDKGGDQVPDAPAPQQPEPAKALPAGHLESGPVAGLSDTQMNNAKAIVWTGVDIGMPRRALIIAVATAMQESQLLNRASEVLPESKNHPHQGTGWDHDSVGLFQQRTSSGWGPVAKLMDPAYASQQFYYALMRVPGWQHMRVTQAAQAVQVSAFPEHYAKHEHRATQVVNALTDVS